jgi:dipeptidyl aminopeptidase/acylaminoacyl peptidase
MAYAKKPLDHTTFDDWKGVKITSLSNDGLWSAYEVNPQQGDGVLYLRNTASGKEIAIPRGYQPQFTANAQWAAALIKPLYADTRQAKIDKKKDLDLPQDSLAIINLKTGKVEKIANVTSYKIGKDGGEWIAYQSVDTTYIAPKILKKKEVGKPLIVRHLPTGTNKVIRWSKEFSMSKDGTKVGVNIVPDKKDSVAVKGVGVLMLPDTAFVLLDYGKAFYTNPVFSDASDKVAFTASNDTVKSGTKVAQLYYMPLNSNRLTEPEEIAIQRTTNNTPTRLVRPHSNDPEVQKQLLEKWLEAQKAAAGDSIFINQYSTPEFSENGKRLIIGVAPRVAPDDTTIVDFEHAELNIWRWNAPYTPPQYSKMEEKIRKRTYPVAIDLASMKSQLICADSLVNIEAGDRWNSDYVLLRNPSENIISQQWDYSAKEKLSVYNLSTHVADEICDASIECSWLSPMGKYVVWFADGNYYAYDNATKQTRCLSEAIEYPLWDEDQDIPMERQAYGIMGWLANDQRLLVYDRYDIWSLDPSGNAAPVNFTNGNGRKENLCYRYLNTDKDKRYLEPTDEALLTVLNRVDKRRGFATLKMNRAAAPTLKTLEEYTFTQVRKAKNADTYAFAKGNFSTIPEVHIATKGDIAKAKRVTDVNSQKADYSWGDAQLVKWYAYNGDLTEGVLYTPEDLDTNKKYPMLVVFYERNSDELYRHYTMEPSWSWVNYPFYVSRGYVVFVPDVKYAPGIPGESAYNYICSGVEDLCKKYPWIDKDKIGIDGQSWGGYQTSFLVTRTNMFACAGSGAPVSNMTSAFGGIRWGSGDSRQAQYEKGQSRIGRSLWEAPQLYIANSPLFYADRVETPLLIMHNDGDGAVPWYQGIEYFMALRRLNKPVWMLQYKGEAHNIRDRKNRKDITVRLQEFFDHYLKGADMPDWMK